MAEVKTKTLTLKSCGSGASAIFADNTVARGCRLFLLIMLWPGGVGYFCRKYCGQGVPSISAITIGSQRCRLDRSRVTTAQDDLRLCVHWCRDSTRLRELSSRSRGHPLRRSYTLQLVAGSELPLGLSDLYPRFASPLSITFAVYSACISASSF